MFKITQCIYSNFFEYILFQSRTIWPVLMFVNQRKFEVGISKQNCTKFVCLDFIPGRVNNNTMGRMIWVKVWHGLYAHNDNVTTTIQNKTLPCAYLITLYMSKQGLYSPIRRRIMDIGIPSINMGRSSDSLWFITEILIPIRCVFLANKRSEAVVIYLSRFRSKRILNSNLAKSRSSITSMYFVESFWFFYRARQHHCRALCRIWKWATEE